MSVPLVYTMIGQHTTFFAGGNWGIGEAAWPIVFLAIIGLGWHLVFQLYKRSGKVQGLSRRQRLPVASVTVRLREWATVPGAFVSGA